MTLLPTDPGQSHACSWPGSRSTAECRGRVWARRSCSTRFAASDQFGIAALLIHCKDEHARDFYTHHVDALVSPIAPLQLIVPTQTIALALGTAHE